MKTSNRSNNNAFSPTRSIYSPTRKFLENDITLLNSINNSIYKPFTSDPILNISNNKNKALPNNLDNSKLNISFHNIKEENERLKIQNNILGKTNIDLKNQVRLLQIELTSGQNQPFYNQLHSDPQISNYVDNLKGSLATAQNSNEELSNLFEALNKKLSEFSKENLILKEQNVLASKELESLSKKFSDTRYSVDEVTSDLRKLENEKTVLQIHKNDFEEKFKLAEEKVDNLLSINESHVKCKNDNLEMIENLKNTLEAIKRAGGDDDKDKIEMHNKIEELETLLNEKNYANDNLQNKIKNFEKDRDYYNQELKIMENEIKDKNKFIETLQDKYHNLNTENEKLKSRTEALLINIDERDQTIENLKISMNFITNTIEDYKTDYDKRKYQIDGDSSDKNRLSKELELAQKKITNLTSENILLGKDKESLQKRTIEIDQELNEKKNLLNKLTFENDVLGLKLDNTNGFINQLQEDNKNSKMNKINEEFQNEIARSNDDRNKRLKEIEKQITLKNKLIEDLQKQNAEITITKDEKISELQSLINKKNYTEQELENKMNNNIQQIMHDIELSKHEFNQYKIMKESELMDQVSKYNILKNENNLISNRLKNYEKNYTDALGLNPSPLNLNNSNVKQYKPENFNIDNLLNKLKDGTSPNQGVNHLINHNSNPNLQQNNFLNNNNFYPDFVKKIDTINNNHSNNNLYNPKSNAPLVNDIPNNYKFSNFLEKIDGESNKINSANFYSNLIKSPIDHINHNVDSHKGFP